MSQLSALIGYIRSRMLGSDWLSRSRLLGSNWHIANMWRIRGRGLGLDLGCHSFAILDQPQSRETRKDDKTF